MGYSPWGREESDTTERLHFPFSLSCTGEGNGNPLQCSCLENPRDGEPGGLPSMGSHRVRHNWSDVAEAAGCLKREKWQAKRDGIEVFGTMPYSPCIIPHCPLAAPLPPCHPATPCPTAPPPPRHPTHIPWLLASRVPSQAGYSSSGWRWY